MATILADARRNGKKHGCRFRARAFDVAISEQWVKRRHILDFFLAGGKRNEIKD